MKGMIMQVEMLYWGKFKEGGRTNAVII